MSKNIIAVIAVAGLALAAQADITTSITQVNNSAGGADLSNYRTWDIGANTGSADWTQAQLLITLSTGTIYINALNGGYQAPNPAFVGLFPALGFTSYVTDGVSSSVSIGGGAVNLGGAPAASFTSTGANVTWFTTNTNDFNFRNLLRLSLSSDASGTWQMQVRAGTSVVPVTIGGSFTNGMLAVPAPATAAVFGLGGLVAARRRRAA